MSVDPGQMDQHMARALSFRCRVCHVAFNKAQVHKLLYRGNMEISIICYCVLWDLNMRLLNFVQDYITNFEVFNL